MNPSRQHIQIAVDAVVFGYRSASGLSVLLIRRRFAPHAGAWALPGGFVRDHESLEEAVSRELEEETGVNIRYLEQLYTFGDADRDPRGRVVSVTYFALVKPENLRIFADSDAEETAWFDIQKLPELAFDHPRILKTAIERIRNKISYEPIGFELLEEKFPFADLHTLYETLRGAPIDRRNFKKKMMSLQILEESGERRKQAGSGRPAALYQFNKEKYFQLKEKGIVFEV
ncbi:MAG: NUDIX hydrolase [Bacteroidetes bacterium]|nr:MAG: NUDIX hydrolase [Bacteroidota bacterium]